MKRKFFIIPLLIALLFCLASCDYDFSINKAIELVQRQYGIEKVFSVCNIDEKKVSIKENNKESLKKFKQPYFLIGIYEGKEKFYIVDKYNDHPSLEVEWIFDTPFFTIIDRLNAVKSNAITEYKDKNDFWMPYYTYITADIETISTFYIENIDNYTLDENAPFMLQINDYAFIQQDGQMIAF